MINLSNKLIKNNFKVQTFGDLTFSCMPSAQNAPLIFSFNNGNNYTKLPPWRSPSRGTLGLYFWRNFVFRKSKYKVRRI